MVQSGPELQLRLAAEHGMHNSNPDVFGRMKGSWRAFDAWHCEKPGGVLVRVRAQSMETPELKGS